MRKKEELEAPPHWSVVIIWLDTVGQEPEDLKKHKKTVSPSTSQWVQTQQEVEMSMEPEWTETVRLVTTDEVDAVTRQKQLIPISEGK